MVRYCNGVFIGILTLDRLNRLIPVYPERLISLTEASIFMIEAFRSYDKNKILHLCFITRKPYPYILSPIAAENTVRALKIHCFFLLLVL